MFGKRIPLFKIFGFRVNVDTTWFILAILITWTLAEEYFPSHLIGHMDLSRPAYWGMGIVGAFGLFASIVFHEFFHSLVARYYGLPMKGITLFIFGGVAEMAEEPDNPKTEFLMAIAGPISSIILGTGFYFVFLAVGQTGRYGPVRAVLHYLFFINFFLAGLNMLPAFPLDGGRVLRSILWSIKKDLLWATKIASRMGSGFGLFLIIMGLYFFISRQFFPGVWFALIGMFIRDASRMSYKRLLRRQAMNNEEIRYFMHSEQLE